MEKLTTKELLVLSVLEQAINEEVDMTTISWDSAGIKYDEETRIFEILEDYGYIAPDDIEEGVYEITNQGYQYLRLCEKELEEAEAQIKNGNKQIKFSLINIDDIDIQLGLINGKAKAQLGASKIYNGFKTLIDMMHKKN